MRPTLDDILGTGDIHRIDEIRREIMDTYNSDEPAVAVQAILQAAYEMAQFVIASHEAENGCECRVLENCRLYVEKFGPRLITGPEDGILEA